MVVPLVEIAVLFTWGCVQLVWLGSLAGAFSGLGWLRFDFCLWLFRIALSGWLVLNWWVFGVLLV